jgi:hypothetical protein
MSDTEAVPDTPVEETPNVEEPLNDVSTLSKVGWRGPQFTHGHRMMEGKKKCEGLTFVCPCYHFQQEGKLYVGNLAFKTTEEGLREAFGSHGEITFARVISDRDSGRSRYVLSSKDASRHCAIVA